MMLVAVAFGGCLCLVILAVAIWYFTSQEGGSPAPAPGTPPAATPRAAGTPPAATPPAAGTPLATTPPAAGTPPATCPANHYKFGANGSCVSCPAGTTSPAGSTNARKCVYPSGSCGANKYWSGGSCINCPPGSYSNQGSSSINDCYCGGNTIMNANKTGCDPCPAPPTGYVFRDPTGCATTIQFACYEAGPSDRMKPCCPGLTYNDGECY